MSSGRRRPRLPHPFQGKERILSFQVQPGGFRLTLNSLACALREVTGPSPTLVGQGNLPSNLGALVASPARTDAATDHLNFEPELVAKVCPFAPCTIASYLLGSASGPSRAAAPAAAHPALRSGPTCSRGPARAPLPRGSLPGPSLAAAVSVAAAASTPSFPAPGRASPCPPLGQRQPHCTAGRRALGARWVPGARSRTRLRRVPLCSPQAPGLRALSGIPSTGSEVTRQRVCAQRCS